MRETRIRKIPELLRMLLRSRTKMMTILISVMSMPSDASSFNYWLETIQNKLVVLKISTKWTCRKSKRSCKKRKFQIIWWNSYQLVLDRNSMFKRPYKTGRKWRIHRNQDSAGKTSISTPSSTDNSTIFLWK